MPVIMGRKTFESVNKPLPGRFNIVITKQAGLQKMWKRQRICQALQKTAATNCKDIHYRRRRNLQSKY